MGQPGDSEQDTNYSESQQNQVAVQRPEPFLGAPQVLYNSRVQGHVHQQWQVHEDSVSDVESFVEVFPFLELTDAGRCHVDHKVEVQCGGGNEEGGYEGH